MNKDIKSIIGISAVCLLAMASCSKSSSSPSASANLTGTWKISQEYIDTNNNGIQDANELFTDTSVAHITYVFNANGTIISTYYSAVTQGSWALVNNNTYLKVTDTGVSGGTEYDLIQTLNSTSLVIKDTTKANNGFITWTYFTKQ